jgi:Na+/melibiose symporter-like transporter
MCLAQLSKIVCYNPDHPYLVIIPTIMLSMGMLFFFTLGSSMVGDICDEDELKSGYRAEGSFYSIFWWFIKMGTAFASFVGGALILLTMFDETQVTKVDAFRGSIRELRKEVQMRSEGKAPEGNLEEMLEKARMRSSELLAHLEGRSATNVKSKQHYDEIILNINGLNDRMIAMNASASLEEMAGELEFIENGIGTLTRQTPYTLLMMRVVEIGLPLLLSIFSILFVFRYALTEKRSHEIKELLMRRNEENSGNGNNMPEPVSIP